MVNHFYEISTAIFMACFTAWLGWRTWNKIRRISAGDKFKTTILQALSDVYQIASDWPENIDNYLRSKFPVLQAAANDFSGILRNNEKSAFDEAWFIYRVGENGREIDKQCYHQYMGFSSPDEPNKDHKKAFYSNVSNLLSFTNQT